MNPLHRPAPQEDALPFPPERRAPVVPHDAPEDDSASRYWDHCPNCGAALQNIRCKYRCPRCFYFMSCSDFD